ncbi:MAG: hypothetical protein L0216_07595 [Planctomycetales bacterium]|nr:hypothetical protein [Planctomycetales bacterium]
MRRPGALALALVAAGCGAAPLVPLDEEPRIVALRAAGTPLPVRIAVASPDARTQPPREHAGAVEWDPVEIQAAAAEALRAAGIAAGVRVLPAGPGTGGTPGAGDAAREAAWEDGDDLVLDLTVTRFEAGYVGTNGWYLPNLILWALWIWPAWFVPDEDYDLRIEAEARLTAVASGRPVWTGRIEARIQESFDDFARGLVLFAILRVPSALDEGNWRRVAEALRPATVRELQLTLAEGAAAGLRAAASGELAAATRKTLGLAIGCGTYRSPSLHPIPDAAADARAVASWLRRSGVPERQIALLEDDAATKERVLERIRSFLVARARPGDRVIVSFSGYAGLDASGDVALLPHDADPLRTGETGIPLRQLAREVGAIPGADLLLLLDAGLGGSSAERWADPASRVPDRAAVEAALRAVAARPRTAVVTAAEPGNGAGEAAERGRGLLTFQWLRAAEWAEDRDGDGRLSAGEVFLETEEGVQTHALLSGRNQRPVLHGDGGAFEIPRPTREGEGGGA